MVEALYGMPVSVWPYMKGDVPAVCIDGRLLVSQEKMNDFRDGKGGDTIVLNVVDRLEFENPPVTEASFFDQSLLRFKVGI